MKNIRLRIIGSLVLFSLLATMTAGGFSLAYIKTRIMENTYEHLTESARVYGNEMNTVIAGMEATVDSLSRSIVGVLDKSQMGDPAYFYEFSEEIEKIAAQFDRNSIKAMSVYARFDPAISYSTAGFFHADTNGDGVLEQLTPTDLSLYEPTDREHVGWFYEPLTAGKPIWMNPYHNANINIDMLSYIAPIFVDGKAIGVVGVDINFAQLKDIVAQNPKVGKSLLMNSDYQFLVHDIFKPTDRLSEIDDGKLKWLQTKMETNEYGAADYMLFGVKKVLGFSRLQNGWTVVVAMTEEEAFADMNRSISMLMALNLSISLGMIVVALFVGRYLNTIILRNTELEGMVQERTQQLVQTNEYLEESMAELENHQADLTLVNARLEDSLNQLRETQDQLIISEKLASLGELVAGVAHEINTPLGIGVTLNSYIDQRVREARKLFDDGCLSQSDLEDYLQSTLEASELSVRNLTRAAEIIETFKQVAVDQSTLDVRKINLCDYISKVMMNLSPKLKGTPHQILNDCDEAVELITYPGVLAQIITNLVMNSLIHGFQGIPKGTVRIRACRRGNLIDVVYTDDGVGIPPENIDRIFNPFFSTRRNKGSSGLGLHIIHNLVTQTLKGTILVHSTVNQGVEFRITFPEIPLVEEN